jgi:3-oxoacyl-[acyl-carrier protein] reductase
MMMLESKTAVIYGGGGAVGGAVARAFADAGARVHLAGRSTARLEKVASDIGAAVAEVDALDEQAVADHADSVAAEAGGIDIALNAVSFPFAHDAPFVELTVEEVMRPIDTYLRTNLITARAVARHMTARRSGTILTLSAGAARVAPPGSLGYGTTCAAIETLTQRLAVELGPSGVRVVCLRPHLIADAPAHGSYTAELFERRAAAGRHRRRSVPREGTGERDAAGTAPDAGRRRRCGGLRGVRPRTRDHRRGDRPDLRQRRAHRCGAGRSARLVPPTGSAVCISADPGFR